MKKYDNFCKSLENLKECEEIKEPYSPVELMGITGLFSLCFEMSWKLIKELLEYHGYFTQKTGSPRMILKIAFEWGMISNEGVWLEILDTRNLLSHVYDEGKAESSIEKIKTDFIPAFEELKREIDDKWLNG